jgi:hypothetical protein
MAVLFWNGTQTVMVVLFWNGGSSTYYWFFMPIIQDYLPNAGVPLQPLADCVDLLESVSLP